MEKTAVLFGGNGFIGSYLAVMLIEQNIASRVVLADIVHDESEWPEKLKNLKKDGAVSFVNVDVREPIDSSKLPEKVDLIVNLAAVHREPGHKYSEYFHTNLPGAENICDFAEKVNCKDIIFTSSIAVYGTEENSSEQKTEHSLPMPNTAYGISKLLAEKIHIAWQKSAEGRRLMIVRPGVIFGAGEKGNVTRMVRAIIGRYFVFTGNKNTRKAGGYVKELCRAILWMHEKQKNSGEGLSLFNFSMSPTPTVEEFSKAIISVFGKKRGVPSVPHTPLLLLSKLWSAGHKLAGRETGINPARVHKLRRSNYIVPQVLQERGYEYSYDLRSAMEDWKSERPKDWR